MSVCQTYKLGIAIYRYEIELILLDENLDIIGFISSELPKGDDPMPHTAELIRKNFSQDLLNNISFIGCSFPGYFDDERIYLTESYHFPEYEERPFLEELKLALQISQTNSLLLNPAECDFCYARMLLDLPGNLMAISLKQGVFAKVELSSSWQKIINWTKLGHRYFNLAENNLCICGGKGCLETLVGDVPIVKQFSKKFDLRKLYFDNFIAAMDNKNEDALKLFKANLVNLFAGLAFDENFYNSDFSVVIGSNIICPYSSIFENVSFELMQNKNVKPKMIIAEPHSTVMGAALAGCFSNLV